MEFGETQRSQLNLFGFRCATISLAVVASSSLALVASFAPSLRSGANDATRATNKQYALQKSSCSPIITNRNLIVKQKHVEGENEKCSWNTADKQYFLQVFARLIAYGSMYFLITLSVKGQRFHLKKYDEKKLNKNSKLVIGRRDLEF